MNKNINFKEFNITVIEVYLLSKYLNFDNGKDYFNLRMMLNLFLDLRNTNFDDERTLNIKEFN